MLNLYVEKFQEENFRYIGTGVRFGLAGIMCRSTCGYGFRGLKSTEPSSGQDCLPFFTLTIDLDL
jgi:hypothetical protein